MGGREGGREEEGEGVNAQPFAWTEPGLEPEERAGLGLELESEVGPGPGPGPGLELEFEVGPGLELELEFEVGLELELASVVSSPCVTSKVER